MAITSCDLGVLLDDPTARVLHVDRLMLSGDLNHEIYAFYVPYFIGR